MKRANKAYVEQRKEVRTRLREVKLDLAEAERQGQEQQDGDVEVDLSPLQAEVTEAASGGRGVRHEGLT